MYSKFFAQGVHAWKELLGTPAFYLNGDSHTARLHDKIYLPIPFPPIKDLSIGAARRVDKMCTHGGLYKSAPKTPILEGLLEGN